MYGANIIIFEGILSFATPKLRALMDLKIFVDEDADIRLARRCFCSITCFLIRVACVVTFESVGETLAVQWISTTGL